MATMESINDWFSKLDPNEYPYKIVFLDNTGHYLFKDIPINKVLIPADIPEYMTLEFDSSHGDWDTFDDICPKNKQGCPMFYAWSDMFVYYRHDYDGKTELRWVPRFVTTEEYSPLKKE